MEYLIYHVKARSCKAVTSCAFLILSFIIRCAIQTAPATNQNCSGSLVPVPLKIGIFITFSMLNGGNGGGGGEGVGV